MKRSKVTCKMELNDKNMNYTQEMNLQSKSG